jgi:hypothetical protein
LYSSSLKRKIMNNIAFNMKLIPPLRIPDPVAKAMHVDYLLHGPHALVDDKIVHSLIINGQDWIDLQSNNNVKGLRLYFCKEADRVDVLSIITVPIDENGENIEDSDGVITYNNFHPCPDECPGNTDYRQSVSETDLNYKEVLIDNQQTKVWCKPNLHTSLDNTNWFDVNNAPVIIP